MGMGGQAGRRAGARPSGPGILPPFSTDPTPALAQAPKSLRLAAGQERLHDVDVLPSRICLPPSSRPHHCYPPPPALTMGYELQEDKRPRPLSSTWQRLSKYQVNK